MLTPGVWQPTILGRQENYISIIIQALGGKSWSRLFGLDYPSKTNFRALDKRLFGLGLIVANIFVVVAAVFLMSLGSSGKNIASGNALAVLNGEEDSVLAVDSLSASEIAVNVSRMSNMPTAPVVAYDAQVKDQAVVADYDSQSLSEKPQVVETKLKSRHDIKSYVVKKDDTIGSIAKKFGVTSDSIRWSNNISGSTVSTGKRLVIPPVDGIVYTVKRGDTVAALANKYNVDKNQLIAFNDAEVDGLPVGERIVIPGGEKEEPAQVRVTPNYGGGYSIAEAIGGCVLSGGFVNCFGYGGCTAYAQYHMIKTGWPVVIRGTAAVWDSAARSLGYTVNHTPAVGAIMQNGWNLGTMHVAVVNKVYRDANGNITGVQVSEQNYGGTDGYRGIEHHRDIMGSSVFLYNYIHR